MEVHTHDSCERGNRQQGGRDDRQHADRLIGAPGDLRGIDLKRADQNLARVFRCLDGPLQTVVQDDKMRGGAGAGEDRQVRPHERRIDLPVWRQYFADQGDALAQHIELRQKVVLFPRVDRAVVQSVDVLLEPLENTKIARDVPVQKRRQKGRGVQLPDPGIAFDTLIKTLQKVDLFAMCGHNHVRDDNEIQIYNLDRQVTELDAVHVEQKKASVVVEPWPPSRLQQMVDHFCRQIEETGNLPGLLIGEQLQIDPEQPSIVEALHDRAREENIPIFSLRIIKVRSDRHGIVSPDIVVLRIIAGLLHVPAYGAARGLIPLDAGPPNRIRPGDIFPLVFRGGIVYNRRMLFGPDRRTTHSRCRQSVESEVSQNSAQNSVQNIAPNVAPNVARVRAQIARAAERAGRNPADITLVAVTKTVPPVRIAEAYAAGIRDFGENYVQEALPKIAAPELALPGLRWHFIGHLQSNKARFVAGQFVLIQSVDSQSLAEELSRRAAKINRTVDILLEVKIDPAETKHGLPIDRLQATAGQISTIAGARLRGLMGVPPYGVDPETVRPYFRRLRTLFETLPPEARSTLSMGMTHDFEVAIEEGATLVRLGTALFGRRPA